MITVHHLNNSRSQRILWLLEELGVPYEIKRYERDPKTLLAPPELKRIHPLGKSPVITDGDLVIAESGAILEYLVEKYGQGKLKPIMGSPEDLRYRYWMHYAEGSAMAPLLLKLIFGKIESSPAPFFMKPILKGISKKVNRMLIGPQLKSHLEFMESELGKNSWFAGPIFSAADIQMSFPVEGFAARGGLNSSHPKLTAYLKNIHERPAYKRALEKGGPFSLLLSIVFVVLLGGCASKEKKIEAPAQAELETSEPSIDIWGIQRTLKLVRDVDDLGYEEGTFNTCRIGYGYSATRECANQTMAVIHYRLQCRDSEGTISNALGASDLQAIAGKPVQWTMGGQTGTSVTDGEGYGQIRAVFAKSPRTQRLKLASGNQFLHMRAGDISRIVVPKPWCQR